MSRVARSIFEDATKATRIDEVSATLTYIGEAEIGTVDTAFKWKIKRMNKTGNVTAIEWADGNDKADNQWSDRANLSYS